MRMRSTLRGSRATRHRVLGSIALLFAHVAFPAAHAGSLDSSAPAFKSKAATTAHSNEADAGIRNQIGTVVRPGPAGVNYTASFDRGWFDIELSGLPALPSAKFLGNSLASVTESVALMVPGETITQQQDVNPFGTKLRFVANLRGTGSSQFLLEVVNADGVLLCSASGSTTQMATCDLQITYPQYTNQDRFRVRATNKGSGSSQLRLESYSLREYDQLGIFSGPGSVAANETFRVRATHTALRIVPPGTLMATFLRVYSATGQFVKEIPVRIRWDGSDYSAMPLLGSYEPTTQAWNKSRSSIFLERTIHAGAFVDVPVNATSVTFSARRPRRIVGSISEDATRDIDLYLVPPSNSTQDPSQARVVKVSTAAAAFQATTVDNSPNAFESITVADSSLTPGRWYVIPVSKTGEPMNLAASALFNSFGPAPDFQSGHYFNPSRSGHGAFLDFAGDQWVMVWYTYQQDGTPTWYYAAAPAPTPEVGNAIWQANLNRVVWDGSQTFAYDAGIGTVTVLGDNSFQFSYILDGEAGSEKMVRLGGPGCVPYNGNGLDATGHWFSPSKSGFGYSAQFEPGTEVHVAYMYDARGEPRWLYGQKSYDPAVNTLNMLQLGGFCPLCTAVSPTNTRVGTLVRTLGPAAVPDGLPGLTNVSLNATLVPPLSGTWSENLPVGLLSARKNCR